ncbi:DUF3135 domain-containing protein [Thermodesulfobacteriota bacterium]
MKKSIWEEEKEETKKRALEEHARLHRLFKDDRLSFERERKRMIDEVINGTRDEEQRNRLRALQDSWDGKMKNAESKHDRLVIAQHLFWSYINEIWDPSTPSRLN